MAAKTAQNHVQTQTVKRQDVTYIKPVLCKDFCPISDKKARFSIKKQYRLHDETGPFSTKKWPSNFSKACLLHDNVNILYLTSSAVALFFSISSENPYISAVTQ